MAAKLAFTTGTLGALAILLLTVLGGAAFPNYSHLSQFISELGAREAPHGKLVSFAGFLPAGVLLCAFAFFASRALPRSPVTLLGLMGVAFFALGYGVAAFLPCEQACRPVEPSLSQAIHNLVGATGYFSGGVGLILLGTQARSWPEARHLWVLGVSGGVLSLVSLLFLSPAFPFVGLVQRVIETCMLLWIVACGVYLRRMAR
ncbi:DUF998 domain-containing protein [Hyalangium rubrum]|uniref:DUF998 domain-containing protein n=1 Tax=Hyalangium rubrum TaxID=3103134 RepID=A0ABU5GZR0_9BACT|nr:DUF998 domain-containing protein [Hyalangium sp. s54d21]MDY7226669.1 DUF998 domain-containing protein [Hyalangium sp. s54d21]